MEVIMKECKNCEHCNIYTNTCLIDDSKCYEKGKLLKENCEFYEEGKWTDM